MAEYVIFYVDPDDEIPSFVARMKDTDADFVVLVVPYRAILFSSIITMRILKREADHLGKDIFIVTQDEQGFEMAKRVGFIVRKTIEEIPFVQENRGLENTRENSQKYPSQQQIRPLVGQEMSDHLIEKQRSFDSVPVSRKSPRERAFSGNVPNPVRSVAQALSGVESSPNGGLSSPLRGGLNEKHFLGNGVRHELGSSAWRDEKMSLEHTRDDSHKDIQEISQKGEDISKEDSSVFSDSFSDKEAGKNKSRFRWMWIFGVIIFVSVISAIVFVGFIWVPEVRVTAYPKKENVSGDVNYTLSVEKGNALGAYFLEYNEEIKMTDSTTGIASSKGKRASGTVTIYNTFSKEAQPLVATTRLQSPDGKIFRITKSIIVPGMQEKEGVMEPGKVDVEVQADSAGAEYNIQATKFTIPGFSGGPKYEKIYAESTRLMSGGGSDGDTGHSVSEQDVSRVKKNVEAEVRKKVSEKVKTESPSNVILDELIEVNFFEEKQFPSIGTVTDTFEFQARISVRYFVFSQRGLEEEVLREMRKNDLGENEEISPEGRSVHIEYGKITPDFEKRTVDMKMFVSGYFFSEIPVDEVRRDILGIPVEDLQSILDKYERIQHFEVEMSGLGVKNFPEDPKKVHIEVRQEE